jgi:carboxypeptidase Q
MKRVFIPPRILPRFQCWAIVLALAAVFLPSLKLAQNPAGPTSEQNRAYGAAMEDADGKIFAEIKARSELMKNLEYITGMFSPRLVGSPQMQKASDWGLQRFRDYGFDAHRETGQVDHGWYRGDDTAEIVSPFQRSIPIRSYVWSMATKGEVTGPVVFLDEASIEEVLKNKDRLKGKIVCLTKPSAVLPAGQPAENSYDALSTPSPPAPQGRRVRATPPVNRYRINEVVAETGALAILADSNKPDRLFHMSHGSPCCVSSALPMAFLTHEDYDLVYRWSQRGPVQMKINLKGTFSPGPEPFSIIVAEIKGSEHPEERVIIGGHPDGYDLAEGALDDAVGAMATLEAARTLKSLGWQPKRTITFVLFTGEELGGLGSALYLKNHEAEIPKMDAALVLDYGTGRVSSIALENLWGAVPMMYNIYQPLRRVLGLKPLEARYDSGSDNMLFIRAGVPGFICVQAPAQYREAHHSQSDTFDKAIPEDANQGAAVLAGWAWNTSEYPQVMPHVIALETPSP